jgi:hypothetical protein
VRWYDFKVYRMECTPEDERRVVILHTTEFAETPSNFLARKFPECSDFRLEQTKAPEIFSGILLDRW